MKTIALVVVAIVIALAITVLLAKPEYAWLAFHEVAAEEYAIQLLDGKAPKTPDWAVDLVVVAERGTVQFAEHNSNTIYLYSPHSTPNAQDAKWSHIWRAWYVGKI